ncbi:MULTISPECIES: Ig-like domain-containing protein [unclassified Clostridium]|uniref:Ig-like domain-containing protein n=1 Tax=unclassified Clostridium TaxID=2614128 RepID=UPI0002973C5B|nr:MULTISPECIES: Ig-like domain-containing protein [unclassified Clostridium]EKQ53620.1 MAG: Ig-like domain-containing protein,putative cell wall binding protein [Clostridium sp. Maddingley MBC34-26]
MGKFKIKKKLLSMAIVLSMGVTFLSPITAHASTQTWKEVGNAEVSADQAWCTSIAKDRNGTLYVAYGDNAYGGKLTVKKYDGGNWVTVGSAGVSAFGLSSASIAIDSKGAIYVACVEQYSNISTPLVVMKYTDSTGWESVDNTVGNAEASQGNAEYASIAIGADDIPYIAYSDDYITSNPGGATVRKYDGSNWVLVGSAGFSTGQAFYTSIAIDGSGTPYVACQDYGNSDNGATVMKYTDSTGWKAVGTEDFSQGYASYTSIAIDASGTPYIVYSDGDNYYGNGNDAAVVMKFDGSSWVAVGNAGASGDRANDLSIAIGANGKPYFEYTDSESIPYVMKYNGTDWVKVGNAPVSVNSVSDTSMIIGSDGNPYITYIDYGNNQKATVMTIEEDKEITSVDSLNDKTVANGTDKNSIGLPETVDVTLSNGITTSAAVTWDNGSPAYDGNTSRTYRFTGTLTLPDGVLNPNNYTASINVIVQASGELPPVNDETTPAAVRIEGTPKVGETLTAQLKDAGGNNYTTSAAVTYEWYRLDNSDSEFVNAIGTGKTYKLTGSDFYKYIGVRVTCGEYSFEYVIGRILAASSSSSHHHHSSTTDTTTSTETKKDDNTIKKTGWTQDTNDTMYYLKDDGSKTIGWKLIDNKWYFFNNKTGAMVRGWYKSELGDWTYDKKDTVGQWFHLGTDGKMDIGWFKDTDGTWYYLCDGRDYGALGYMETGWKYIDGKWYFLKDNGAMASDTVVEGYTLGSDGALVE